MADPRQQLAIEIEPGPGPPRGRIHDALGVGHPFTGWLGFASVLGQVLEQDRPVPAGDHEINHPTPGGSS